MMETEMKIEQLLEQLHKRPFNPIEMRLLIETNHISSYAVNQAFLEYVEEFFCLDVPESVDLNEIIKTLLDYGLDSNFIHDNTSLMNALYYIDTKYVSADCLRTLLENGGRWDLKVNGDSLFDWIDFDITFSVLEEYDRNRLDTCIHYWLVLIGFGALTNTGKCPVDIFHTTDEEFNEPVCVADFQNHEKYAVGLSHDESHGYPWTLHIFDKETLWEVARL